MKRKIKLRDLTAKQWENWLDNNCNLKVDCENCPIYKTNCGSSEDEICWINNKDIYSDKFLNQEIEIAVPDILTKEEKEYLSYVIKPFRDEIDCIFKHKNDMTFKSYISIKLKDKTYIHFPDLKDNKMYAKMEIDYHYTLEELDL